MIENFMRKCDIILRLKGALGAYVANSESQLASQKLLWRLRATPVGRDFFHRKDQKGKRRELGFALPPSVWCWVAREMAGRAIFCNPICGWAATRCKSVERCGSAGESAIADVVAALPAQRRTPRLPRRPLRQLRRWTRAGAGARASDRGSWRPRRWARHVLRSRVG